MCVASVAGGAATCNRTYEEEDTFMSYEEEDTCVSLLWRGGLPRVTVNFRCT